MARMSNVLLVKHWLVYVSITSFVSYVKARPTRYVLNRYHYSASVTEMLKELGWKSLEERRRYMRLAMIYKITDSFVAINGAQYLRLRLRQNRKCNDFAFILPCTGPDYFTDSFFPRNINEWNFLPNKVVEAPILDSFKTRLSTVS